MKTITKLFKTLRQSENFQNRLYDKYDSVTATRWPLFTEEGIYQWQVKL